VTHDSLRYINILTYLLTYLPSDKSVPTTNRRRVKQEKITVAKYIGLRSCVLISTVNAPICPMGVGDVEILAGAGGRYEVADTATTARNVETVTRCMTLAAAAAEDEDAGTQTQSSCHQRYLSAASTRYNVTPGAPGPSIIWVNSGANNKKLAPDVSYHNLFVAPRLVSDVSE